MKDGPPNSLPQPARADANVSPAAVHLAGLLGNEGNLRRLFVGTVLAHPWFDAVTLSALRHLFFPASRLLAAAQIAQGDATAFLAAVPMPEARPSARLKRLVAHVEQVRAASAAIDKEWERLLFEGAGADDCTRVSIEAARIRARHDLNSLRWRLRLNLPRGVPTARLALERPEDVAGRLDACLAGLFEPPCAPNSEVIVSKPVATSVGVDYWLRFRSPSTVPGDVVTARVHEPRGAKNPPTLIFGHGVCVDFDHWMGLIDESVGLVAHGFRVIRPEAPWHGRRTPPGTYAGERTVATFPTGIVDSMRAAVAEWRVLDCWARENSTGRLAFGGSSLGAMTAQLAASALKPDALFLVTHTADMTAVALHGALSNLWGSAEDYMAIGWTPERAERYLALLNAPKTCPVPPDRVISVIGRRDQVLPFDSGRSCLETWGVPAANIFEWDRGHFTVPATMIRRREPLQRLAKIMNR